MCTAMSSARVLAEQFSRWPAAGPANLKPPYYRVREPPSATVASGDPTLMLLHLIAEALMVGTVAVPLCLLRLVYRLVKKPATRR